MGVGATLVNLAFRIGMAAVLAAMQLVAAAWVEASEVGDPALSGVEPLGPGLRNHRK